MKDSRLGWRSASRWTLLVLLIASSAFAQPRPTARRAGGGGAAALREVGFDQNLNQMLPLDVEFTDEHGRTVKIGDYFGKRPVVLAFVYYGCPMLCLQSLSSLAARSACCRRTPATTSRSSASASILARRRRWRSRRRRTTSSDRANRRSRRAGTI